MPSFSSQKIRVPVADLIGFKLLKAGKGTAVCTLQTKTAHENFIGSVHGGILCDLSDAAMGLAFLSLLPKGQTGVTVEFKINFLKPVYAGDVLKAKARVVSAGKSLCYLECEVLSRRGQLAAKAASTCKKI